MFECLCFSLAILLVKREKLVIVLVYLGSLFATLDDYVAKIVSSVLTHAGTSFLKVFPGVSCSSPKAYWISSNSDGYGGVY